LGVGGGIVYPISSTSTGIKLYSNSSYSDSSSKDPGWHFNISLEIDNNCAANDKYDKIVTSKYDPE
jgi:hypothetical protein